MSDRVREGIRDILAICSRRPHRKDTSGHAVSLIADIECIAGEIRDELDAQPTGVARAGVEAQYGINDTWPGDPYP